MSTSESPGNGGSSGRILDLKTGTVKKEGHQNSTRSHLGTRRSFICRIKFGSQSNKPYTHQANPYALHQQQQTGYIDQPWLSSSSQPAAPRLNRPRCTLDAADPAGGHKAAQYAVVHVTGYTKIWPPQSQTMMDQHHHQAMYMDENQPTHNNFHLIAIARLQMTSTPSDLVQPSNYEFVTRHDHTGAITFVDQRSVLLLLLLISTCS